MDQAGMELNREIATRLGYRVEQDNNRYYLIRPDGRYVWGAGTLSAEKRSVASGRSNPDDFFDPEGNPDVPNWSSNVDAALKLCQSVYAHIQLFYNAVGRTWSAHLDDPGNPWGVQREADTPALALCRAWLVWMDKTVK